MKKFILIGIMFGVSLSQAFAGTPSNSGDRIWKCTAFKAYVPGEAQIFRQQMGNIVGSAEINEADVWNNHSVERTLFEDENIKMTCAGEVAVSGGGSGNSYRRILCNIQDKEAELTKVSYEEFNYRSLVSTELDAQAARYRLVCVKQN
ncbi:MAG: hypothetical protein KF865_01600 [Bdellovibrionaceae bacterium]|nr:hypothetical protein [Pseudobdellovibrionaceae bacterium]